MDPTRIAAYVVWGIGFHGAGGILRDGVNIRGIDTAAATICCCAAVGVLAGAGYLPEAVAGAALVVLAHLLLRPVAADQSANREVWAGHHSGCGR